MKWYFPTYFHPFHPEPWVFLVQFEGGVFFRWVAQPPWRLGGSHGVATLQIEQLIGREDAKRRRFREGRFSGRAEMLIPTFQPKCLSLLVLADEFSNQMGGWWDTFLSKNMGTTLNFQTAKTSSVVSFAWETWNTIWKTNGYLCISLVGIDFGELCFEIDMWLKSHTPSWWLQNHFIASKLLIFLCFFGFMKWRCNSKKESVPKKVSKTVRVIWGFGYGITTSHSETS